MQDSQANCGPFALKNALSALGIERSAEELEKSKQNLIRALPAQFETNAATAASFAELALHGLPDDWYAHYAGNVRKVTAADVKALANTALPSKQMVFAIVGDMSKVRADLDALHLGTAEMHDLYGMPM